MKVAELEGALLDHWVARAEGLDVRFCSDRSYVIVNTYQYSPSSRWSEAGPIIEREGIGIWKGYDSESGGKKVVWEATTGDPVRAIEISGAQGEGPTPLIAAMRAYVRLKFGKEVEDAPLVRADGEG